MSRGMKLEGRWSGRPSSWRMCKEVAVAEDWYPTVDGLVRVSLFHRDGFNRVCVWGGDDFGLEYDTTDLPEARRLFDRINHLVTKDSLRSWGFVRA